MRLKFLNLMTILLLAGSSDGRPQQLEVSENLQPATVENDDTGGWRPVQHDAKIAQESIPVDKDLPQIVEGNSRYTEEWGARRRKSYPRNNPFYEDHITIFGDEKVSDRGVEPLDLEASESEERFERSNTSEGIGHRINDETMIRGRNSSIVKISSNYTIGRNKIEGSPIEVINLKNNYVMLNRTADDGRNFRFMIDEASKNVKSNSSYNFIGNLDNTDPLLGSENVSDADKRPANNHRKRISPSYRGHMKSSPLLLRHVSNVDSLLYLNRNTSYLEPRVLGNESQTRMGNLRKIRPQVTLHSRYNANGYKPIRVNKEKVMKFFKILPTHSGSKNFTNGATFSQSNLHDLHNIHNQVFGMGPDNSKIEIKLVASNSNETGSGVQRLVINKTRNHEFDSKNSTRNRIKVRPQPNGSLIHSVIKNKDHEANGQEYSKISLKIKPNSSQSIPVLNLKNWPNGNLQNIEDLYNYQKYTSFHNGDGNVEAQETSDDLITPHVTPSNVHKVTKKPGKKKGPKPSVTIFGHSSAPPSTVQNSQVDTTTSYDPETHVNLDQTGQGVSQWEQIHQSTSNNTNFLTDEDTFYSVPEGLEPNRPLNPDHGQSQNPNYQVDEISIGQTPPFQIAQNYDQASVQDGEYYQNQHDQQTFDYPNLENDFNPADVTRPTSGTDESDGAYNVYQIDPVRAPDPSKQPYFNPLSVVSQNTVVHILNAGKKRPNITVAEMKVTRNHSEPLLNPEEQPADAKNSSASTPNVHIMFTTDEDQVEANGPQYGLTADQIIPEVTYDEGINCPTIKINSYTRINNTIQGKEGCTDLNIIINSHVLNTNVFNPAATSAGNYGSGDKLPSERYPGNGQAQPSYGTSDGSYAVPSGGSYGTYPTGGGQNTGGFVPGDLQDYPLVEGQNPVNLQDSQFGQQPPGGTSTFEVFQQTQINIGSQDDVLSAGDALDPVVSNDPASLGDGAGAPGAGVSNDPVIPAEVAGDPGVAGPAPGGGTPSFPPFTGIEGPPADVAADTPADVAADAPAGVAADAPASGGSSGIQFPGGSNPLSGITNQLSDFAGNLGSQPGNGDSSILGGGDDDDDDDDDDDGGYDDDMVSLMPFSIIESAISILSYFTLLNPLNYGFLSIAISPIAVAVAGLFGLAAAFVPFALPSVFSFGRSASQGTMGLKSGLEQVVTRSIEQYENWNEWKSKRKKRRR